MNEVAKRQSDADVLEQVIIKGDLAQLKPIERVQYYSRVCESVGLNAFTKPFEYIELNGKLTLYALKTATDQLRKVHGVSITRIERERIDDIYVVTAYARDKDGREDSSTGAVSLTKEGGSWQPSNNGKRYFKGDGSVVPLRGDDLANAFMKAETKAKRRVTLSICGLGMLDETEVETIPNAQAYPVEELHQEPEVIEELITPKQVTALAIALKEADFGTDDHGKQLGRDFIAYLVGLERLASIKDLTKEQAKTALDRLGSDQGGQYRTDKRRLEQAVQDWAEHKANREFERSRNRLNIPPIDADEYADSLPF
jgi:hypothetical protein